MDVMSAACHSKVLLRQIIPNGFVKNALQVSLGQCRAFQILVRLNFFGADQSLVIRDGLHSLRAEAL